METDQLAKVIAERVIAADDKRLGSEPDRYCMMERSNLCRFLAEAIRDLNLMQDEPIPAGAVPVVVYVGVSKYADGSRCVTVGSVDDSDTESDAMDGAFSDDDTHRVRLEGYALPVSVPTVKAISKEIK